MYILLEAIDTYNWGINNGAIPKGTTLEDIANTVLQEGGASYLNNGFHASFKDEDFTYSAAERLLQSIDSLENEELDLDVLPDEEEIQMDLMREEVDDFNNYIEEIEL